MDGNKLAITGGPKVKTIPFGTGKRFGQEEANELLEALEQNTLFYHFGNKVKQFLQDFNHLYGVTYSVATSSGTAALHVALGAAGLTCGDEVITSPITDQGTVIGILYQNAIPIFADLDPTSYTLTAKTIEEKITPKTKAIIVVHLAGNPCDMDPIMELAKKYNVKIIEDCAQSYLTTYKGKLTGTIGDYGCFSTNDFKHISTGDGGIVTVNSGDESDYFTTHAFADKNYQRHEKNVIKDLEYLAPNYRMTELQGAVGIAQVKKLSWICTRRNELGEKLNEGLQSIPSINPMKITDEGWCSYWFYMFTLNIQQLTCTRQEFSEALAAEGIPNQPGYIPKVLYAQDLFQKKHAYVNSHYPFELGNYDYAIGSCPNAENILETAIRVDINEFYTDQDIEDMITAIKKVTSYYNRFTDYGIPVSAEEERTAAICINGEGDQRFVIAAKGFIIIVNLENGMIKQLFFPENNVEYPYASFSSNGLFYTAAGNMLIVLDPFLACFIDYKVIENGEEIVGFSFAADQTGNIYFTSYPHCHLLRYSPYTKEILDYGQVDRTEKYPGSVAIDQNGWAYVGIGTENKNIVAFHVENGLKKNLIPEPERKKGSGYVYLGEDGFVYGSFEGENSLTWRKFSNGDSEHIEGSERSPSCYTGTGFQKIHRSQDSNYYIESFSLSEGFIHLVHKESGQSKKIHVSYSSEGAKLSTICLGPDGNLYGTSMHPLQFFQLDLSTNKITNFGGKVIEKGGGGNIAAYATCGNLLIGVAYAGGKLYVLDTSKKLTKNENPRLILQEESIHRPRCAITLMDNEHIVWAGFPGYGMVGGSLGIYHVKTEKNKLLTHDQVVVNQSTICLAQLSSGDIVGGTSIETPGGAESREKEGRLYVLDSKTFKVKNSFVPIKGAREISQLFVDQFDRAHCLTEQSMYFVCNPNTQEILFQKDLSGFGQVVRNGFAFDSRSNKLLCLLSNTLLCIEIQEEMCVEPKVVQSLPKKASSGIVYTNNQIYYSSGSHLCSIYTGG